MYRIGRTADNIKSNQAHSHKFYEVLLYIEGTGYFKTPEKNYYFSPGTIFIIPPNTKHSTISEGCYKNIYINGDLDKFFHFEEVVTITDNNLKEGTQLATMMFNNRYEESDYLSALCSAYIYFILDNLKVEDTLTSSINKIIHKIMEDFFDCSIDLKELLCESGYAEDYIRAYFKKMTGKTPTEFLTYTRIKHACFLIETYEKTLSLMEIAEQCGYTDYIYFSKNFKKITGMSPQKYKNIRLNKL